VNERITDTSAAKAKLPIIVHVLCGWRLLLVVIGGAVGGGLGGIAYATSLAIYKAQLPVALKVVLNLLVGLADIGIWFAVALAISSMRS
jgi:hypothetical protein